jgi:NitT/TauT family transport system permease protein
MGETVARTSGGDKPWWARAFGLLVRNRNFIATFVLLIVLWQAAAVYFKLPIYLFPAPTDVWKGFISQPWRMLSNTMVTAQIIVVGYAIAILVSIPLALLIAFSRVVQTTLYPLLVLFQIIPKIAIAPLFIIWFGFGFMPKVMLVFLLSFFPIVISLKVGAAMAATAAVVAEFVGSDAGLGYLILEYNGFIETPKVFAAIILLSITGLIVYYLVELAERITIPWHVSQAGGSSVEVN